MNRGYPEAIRITLGRSSILATYLHLLHSLLGFFCVTFTPGTLHRVLLLVAVLFSWAVLYSRHLGRQRRVAIHWLPDGSWNIRQHPATQAESMCLRDAFVSHRLTILRFTRGRLGSRYFLVLPDNCDVDVHRRLRIRLRHGLTRTGRVAGNCQGS